MSRVEVLTDALVDQIAAGEVVERPASVVKEAVENALDAGATRVDVAIAEGGIRWIQVTDDGEGLGPEDAARAFLRHATSKLRSADDLARVATLGFRGEALPSIAAVATVRMRTRPADREIGCELAGDPGQGVRVVREVACPEGTRLEVADLFAAIPARRKFLKTAITEGTHIVRWLERIALARPDVRFSLEKDGRASLLFLPTREVRERVIAVLPAGIGERLVSVEGRLADGRADVVGFASSTDVSRSSSTDVHVFVNARPVRDRLLLHAVRQAYRDALPPGRHPAAALYLRVDPEQVDVNVHPAKWEVRFRDPRAITGLIREALVRALGLSPGRPGPGAFPGAIAPEVREPARLVSDGAGATGWAPLPGTDPLLARDTSTLEALGPAQQPPATRFADHAYLGQVLATYLVLAGPGGLVLLDQHAAHERLLFERLRRTLLDGKLERQALLVPLALELGASVAETLRAHARELERAGFELEIAGAGVRGGVRVVLRTVPALLSQRPADWAALLEETARSLEEPGADEERGGIEGAFHGIFASAACHSAVRKGDLLQPREVKALLEGLDEAVWLPNCPHGRPILASLSEAELERRFLRR